MKNLSVIIPVYNAERSLERCVESLLAQTYRDIDIFLVDDGSLDHSLSIAKKYQEIDCRVKVFHKENGGVSSARNIGISNLTTRYYCFVDADDYVDQYYCEHLMNSDADYVITGMEIVHSKTDLKLFGSDTEGIKTIDYYYDNFYELFKLQLTNSPWMRRYDRVISCDLKFDETQKIGEDFIYNLQYVSKCKTIEIIKTYDYSYVINENSATGTYHPTDLSDLLNLYNSINEFSELHNANNGKDVANISLRRGGLQSIHNLFYGKLSLNQKIMELSRWLNCQEFVNSCDNVSDLTFINKLICSECSHRYKNLVVLTLLLKKKIRTIEGCNKNE